MTKINSKDITKEMLLSTLELLNCNRQCQEYKYYSQNDIFKCQDPTPYAVDLLKDFIEDCFDNPPLTLNELKQMIGQPVWDGCLNEWVLVKDVSKSIVGNFVSLVGVDGQEYSVYGTKLNQLYKKE